MTQAPAPPPEPPLTDLTLSELMARVARARLYILESGPGEVPEGVDRARSAYLEGLIAAGFLYGAGPLERYGGTAPGDLTIVAAHSLEAAEAIASADPLRQAVPEVRVCGYTVNEGVAAYIARAMAKQAEAPSSDFAAAPPDDAGPVRQPSGAAGVRLQVVYLTSTGKPRPPEDTEAIRAHFVWLREHEMAARLLNCGPVHLPGGTPPGAWGGGLGVFAVSRDTAEEIASMEPSGVAGYRTLAVAGWRLDYGLAVPLARTMVSLNKDT